MFNITKILLRNSSINQAVRNNYNNVKQSTKKTYKDRGLRRRASLFSDKQNESLETLDMDALEADFHSLGQSYGEHVGQMEAMKEQEKYLIVKQKYFKEKYPNFLTWTDKLQIKYLHGKDPDEWTVDKLSEGFPALPETIEKIIKGSWVKKNNNKALNHDASVQRNWADFKAGKFDLPPILEAHLNKFSNRSIKLQTVDIPENPKTENLLKGGEFSEIITSYQKLKAKTPSENHSSVSIESGTKFNAGKMQTKYITDSNKNYMNVNKSNSTISSNSTNLEVSKNVKRYQETANDLSKTSSAQKINTGLSISDGLSEKELNFVDDDLLENYPGHGEIITLNELRNKLIVDSDHGEMLDADEKLIVGQEKAHMENSSVMKVEEIDLNMAKYVNNTGAVSVWDDKKDYSYLEYPEKIIIPKEKIRKGCTYKLNDCYYDDDGTFLYRVPGMY